MIAERIEILGKSIHLLIEDPSAKTVFLLGYDDEVGIYNRIKQKANPPFNLILITGIDWNNELSPWKHDPIFKGDKGYLGQGDAFLEELTQDIYPIIQKRYQLNPESIALCGYSLAGLFALYAGFKSELFNALLCVSPSFWFTGITEFVATSTLPKNVGYVDLSLGDKEPLTKNPIMSQVGERTMQIRDDLKEKGIDVVFTWNPGGHFADGDKRQSEAILHYLAR